MSSVRSNYDEDVMNLTIVDTTFGKTADLYKDVLKVRPNCSPQKIQESYLKRRDEIMAKLNQLEYNGATDAVRRGTERRMDAVVCTFRILSDSELRTQYDSLRDFRLHPKKARKQQKKKNSSNNKHIKQPSVDKSLDTTDTTTEESLSPSQQPPSPKGLRRKFTRQSTDTESHLSESHTAVSYDYDEEEEEDDEDYTVYTIDSQAERYLAKTPARKPQNFVEKVQFELLGAIDDTSKSFSQVFNVFTLQEKDIRAVMGRIDKAKRQLSSPTSTNNSNKHRR